MKKRKIREEDFSDFDYLSWSVISFESMSPKR